MVYTWRCSECDTFNKANIQPIETKAMIDSIALPSFRVRSCDSRKSWTQYGRFISAFFLCVLLQCSRPTNVRDVAMSQPAGQLQIAEVAAAIHEIKTKLELGGSRQTVGGDYTIEGDKWTTRGLMITNLIAFIYAWQQRRRKRYYRLQADRKNLVAKWLAQADTTGPDIRAEASNPAEQAFGASTG